MALSVASSAEGGKGLGERGGRSGGQQRGQDGAGGDRLTACRQRGENLLKAAAAGQHINLAGYVEDRELVGRRYPKVLGENCRYLKDLDLQHYGWLVVPQIVEKTGDRVEGWRGSPHHNSALVGVGGDEAEIKQDAQGTDQVGELLGCASTLAVKGTQAHGGEAVAVFHRVVGQQHLVLGKRDQ